MIARLDLGSRLPRQLWYEADAAAHDQRHWPHVVAALPKGALVVFDLVHNQVTLSEMDR
jgi:hypothetical protein